MLSMVGFFVGNLLFTAMARWLGLVGELLQSSPQGWRMAAAASLFSSGPWTLVVVGMFVYFVHSEVWAPWFVGGVAFALALFGTFAIIIINKYRRLKAESAKNAA